MAWTPKGPKVLSFPAAHPGTGEVSMDSSVLYDTLLVSWVLGLALYSFALGRLTGSSRSRGRD